MEMTIKATPLDRVFPILCIQDGVTVSKRGEMTIGWEVTLPTLWSVTEDGHDDMLEALSSAVRMLGPRMIVHRQDIYTKGEYRAERPEGFLASAYEKHFDGREHLTHRQYLYLTLAGNDAHARQVSDTSIFGLSSVDSKQMGKDISLLLSKASEFESVLSARGRYALERLSDEQTAALMDAHLRLHNEDCIYSDLQISGNRVKSGERCLWGYSISKSGALPSMITPSRRSDRKSVV